MSCPSEPSLRPAQSSADYDAFAEVCRAYLAWARERHRDLPWFVDAVFGHQSLDDELKVLGSKYGPPNGRTILALADGAVVGAGAWRRLSDGVCELKRLYVMDRARGLGLGRKLSEALMASARDAGFRVMRLDTGSLLKEAIALYGSMGFREIAAYHDYPAKLMPYLIFMERTL